MKIMSICVVTGLVLGLPIAASAQQGNAGDVKYCNTCRTTTASPNLP